MVNLFIRRPTTRKKRYISFYLIAMVLIGIDCLFGHGSFESTVSACQEVSSPTDSTEFSTADLEFFESKIRPLLVEHCYECHSGTDSMEAFPGISRRSFARRGYRASYCTGIKRFGESTSKSHRIQKRTPANASFWSAHGPTDWATPRLDCSRSAGPRVVSETDGSRAKLLPV